MCICMITSVYEGQGQDRILTARCHTWEKLITALFSFNYQYQWKDAFKKFYQQHTKHNGPDFKFCRYQN